MWISPCAVLVLLYFCSPLDAQKSVWHRKSIPRPTAADLVFASVIFRHGDRNPVRPYPNDPWKDETNWLWGFGQLTSIGINGEYELGRYLRRRYVSLLGNGDYNSNNVFVQSTNYNRTLLSASAVLAGLFPTRRGQRIQPIPIHILQQTDDHLLSFARRCKRFESILQRYLDSAEFAELLSDHSEFLQNLEEKTGAPLQYLDDVVILYDTFLVQKLKNKRLPDWAEEIFGPGKEMERISFRGLQLRTNTIELARLSTGFLIRNILDNLYNKSQSIMVPNRSLWLYSAHDSTILNVLNSLGLYDATHAPPYSASLSFELYKKNDEHFVQLVYRNTTTENPAPIHIPRCGTLCKLEEFRAIYKDIIPKGSFETECSETVDPSVPLLVRAPTDFPTIQDNNRLPPLYPFDTKMDPLNTPIYPQY